MLLRPFPPLQAIVDVDVSARLGWEPVALARAFLAGGATCLQVRAKTLGSALLLDLCRAVAREARASGAAVIVNDRADLARLSGASGVHVGQEDLDPADARAVLGSEAVVGLSTHSPDQVLRAVREPITYVAVGPVFGTSTKDTGYEAVGLDLVSQAAAIAGALPVVAIGGITLDTAERVIAAGASSVAVITDLVSTGDPEGRVRAYLERLAR